MKQQDKNWSDYWQNEGVEGEVFVNKQGGRHPFLAQYWQQQFSTQKPGAKIIDIAAGAGSIYSHLSADHSFELHAADISRDALDLLRQRIPRTITHVCPATSIPLSDDSFDFVVSQFGVEYAGIEAFAEAGRLVKPSGQLSVLCHYQNGYIDARNQRMLEGAKIAKYSDFVSDAGDMVTAAFDVADAKNQSSDQHLSQSADNANVTKLQDNFIASQQTLANAIKNCPEGIHAHLYNGFKQLYERRSAYDLADITHWLEDMSADIEKNILRLTEMCHAASSKADIQKIVMRLADQNFIGITQEPVILPDHKLPVAWAITAFKV
jgi:ubiquinone/menaquinone biosynthesis C-methylase UbiE